MHTLNIHDGPGQRLVRWRDMKVFLSWSGNTSKAVAQALREWLPDVIQNLRPWMSQKDLGAGVRWSAEIEGELKSSSFGVICVTKDNVHAPWLNFEAGAISNKLEGVRVVPYIFDMSFADIEGPLTQFQGKEAIREGTWDLVQALNVSVGDGGIQPDRLQKNFERLWPELEEKLAVIPRNVDRQQKPTPEHRSPDDKLDEVLVLLRNIVSSPSDKVMDRISRQREIRKDQKEREVDHFSRNLRNDISDIVNVDFVDEENTFYVFSIDPSDKKEREILEYFSHYYSKYPKPPFKLLVFKKRVGPAEVILKTELNSK